MTITAKLIEHSIAVNGKELITLQLTYPRFIHAEVMTHRLFSRNASSSRAIPVAKMLEQVRTNPAMPIHWGANQPGMQAHAELEEAERQAAIYLWNAAANSAAAVAEEMQALGLHKQVANRILEPFQHIHVIVSATEWENFFQLRDHEDAQPEIRELALQMKTAVAESKPRLLNDNALITDGWHLPYITQAERDEFWDMPERLARVSTARCARVSYLTHDGDKPSMAKDDALFVRLVGGVPLHASPTEHQGYGLVNATDRCKNFVGFHQFRADVEAQFFANVK